MAGKIRYRKILGVSILSIAALAAFFYFSPRVEFDLTHSGEKKNFPPAKVSSKAASSGPQITSVEKKAIADKPELTTPLQSISSEPSSSENESHAPSGIPPKETAAINTKNNETSRKGERIPKDPALPGKMGPPGKRVFFAIKIMALRDPQRAQKFVDSQIEKGLDIHSRTITIQDQGLYHQIFLGHFNSREEAERFFDENKIHQSYPGSTIMKLTK